MARPLLPRSSGPERVRARRRLILSLARREGELPFLPSATDMALLLRSFGVRVTPWTVADDYRHLGLRRLRTLIQLSERCGVAARPATPADIATDPEARHQLYLKERMLTHLTTTNTLRNLRG